MKTREEFKKELSNYNKDELIDIIMQSPAVFGFVLAKCKSLKKDKNKKAKIEEEVK